MAVFSIPPCEPFLPTLARAVLDGRVLPGFPQAGDPLSLASLTVFVPTRRAARTLNAAFGEALGGAAAILPRVRVLGESDAAEGLLSGATQTLVPTMDPLERRLQLARLVLAWKRRLGSAHETLLAGEALVLPASAADAVYLSADLARLLDEAEDEGVGLGALARLDMADRLAEWWQLSLGFLAILTEHWPLYLAERGLCGPAEARNAFAREEAERLAATPDAPVIIAGSTATAPATVALMRCVARLPRGAVVLPGLDRSLDDGAFAAIDRSVSIAAPGHPQHGLKRILAGLGVARSDVVPLAQGAVPPSLAAREAFLSDAFRPAETTDAWQDANHAPSSLDGVALIEAADEREEALAIAVAMRAALARPDATVALTTPDRNLARRVVMELHRFGIEANDSAGRPLTSTPPGTFLQLTLAVALQPGDPVAVLSLLKHPLTRLGLSPADARRAARTLEIAALRGGTGRPDAATLADLLARRRAALAAGERVPSAVHRLAPDDLDAAHAAAERLATALAPLIALRGGPEAELDAYAQALQDALEALATDEGGDPSALYAREAGAALAERLTAMRGAARTGFSFRPDELPDVVAALIAEATVRPAYPASQRAFVWGALEARLQRVDTMILGGLNEGVWPQGARNDAFLSRLMRAELLLDPPERRIGLAAHDVWMAMGTPQIVLTRALRAGGAPAIASRWLQRILTLAGPDATKHLHGRGAAILATARAQDAVAVVPPAARPCPVPPLDIRPARYSVTEVERLIRDPYAVHAKRILRLEPFEDLVRDPAAAERGNLYHAIVARFVLDGLDPDAPDADARLLSIARAAFDEEALPPEVEAVWWPRAVTLCAEFVAWERARGASVRERRAEIGARHLFPDLNVTLTGIADRVDRLADGSLSILDFKTGTQPSVKQARTLLAPQLPLEAGLARLGAFEGTQEGDIVSSLAYVRLRERELLEEPLPRSATKSAEAVTADALGAEAILRFKALAAHYLLPQNGYLSRARPALAGDFAGPYDHLARAREWAQAGEDSEAGSDEGEA